MMKNKLISVITVNFNGIKDTCCFIDSWINKIKSCNYEIIVIDNGSSTNEANLLRNIYKDITVIRSEKNLGFAGANNLGIKRAKGNILFFINNDTIILEDTINELIDKFYKDTKLGGISPIILNDDSSNTIQYAGYTKLSAITLRNECIAEGKNKEAINTYSYTYFLHGAAMLFDRNAIENIGLMDENYFLYYEEIDWCEKFRNKGYKLAVDPSFKIIHKNSRSIGYDSPIKAYYLTRNRLLFAYKNRSIYQLFFIILYHITIAYPFHMIIDIAKSRTDLAKARIKGTIDFFKLL